MLWNGCIFTRFIYQNNHFQSLCKLGGFVGYFGTILPYFFGEDGFKLIPEVRKSLIG